MTFVGREAELNYLDQHYTGEGNRILVVYGQKGVGKTTLLRAFGEDKACAYYVARSCSDREQRYQWAGEIFLENQTDVFHDSIPEYEDIFAQIATINENEKIVMVIDEFHHLVKGESTFFARLNHFVQTSKKPLLVILSSSAAGWVENNLVGKIGSEAASISGFLKVRELSIRQMADIYPEYNEDDCVQLYAVLGGVPGLWNRTNRSSSAKDNIVQQILNPYSAIHGEMTSCLLEDLRETAVYNTILATMAKGGNKLNDIYHHTGFSRAKISVYLKNLMEIDLVEKVGAGTYRITKPHVRFYFCFIYPNQSLVEELTPEQFYKDVVEDAFPGFVREAYRKS